MRERDIERRLVERVRALGGRAYKWTSPGNRGVPDRLVVLPNGAILPVECKAPGRRPTALQQQVIGELRRLEVDTVIIDSLAALDGFISSCLGYLDGGPPRTGSPD